MIKMPVLSSITIKGFKSIASVENLKLGAINIVIGPNGSGKSNFIGAFSFLNTIRDGRLEEYVIKAGGAEKVLHFGSKVTEGIEIQALFENLINKFHIGLGTDYKDSLIPVYERIFYDGLQIESQPALSRQDPKYNNIILTNWRVYHFHDTSTSSPMKKTADLHDNQFLRADAANLASILYLLKEKHPGEYNLIRKTVQRAAPFFDDFQLQPQNLNPNKIILEWKHKGTDSYFDASSLSDGTLRFIALCTLFLQPLSLRPSLILVDEPELGLHPYAITLLASLIKQVSAETQVIVSTQSPLLLDHFEPEDVLVANRVNGGTEFTRLDSAQLSEWLMDYSLGQLWEKNEFGGRPTPE